MNRREGGGGCEPAGSRWRCGRCPRGKVEAQAGARGGGEGPSGGDFSGE